MINTIMRRLNEQSGKLHVQKWAKARSIKRWFKAMLGMKAKTKFFPHSDRIFAEVDKPLPDEARKNALTAINGVAPPAPFYGPDVDTTFIVMSMDAWDKFMTTPLHPPRPKFRNRSSPLA